MNDGSQDQSLEICQVYQNQDQRIHLFSQANQGVSSARNVGLAHASGTWVLFLDSDDVLLPGALDYLNTLCAKQPEYIIAAYTPSLQTSNQAFHQQWMQAENIIKKTLNPMNHDVLPAFYPFLESSLMSCCGKLYALELIQKYHIRFDEKLRLSEDMMFHLTYLQHVQKVLLTDFPVFYYRLNSASATHIFQQSDLDHRSYLADLLRPYGRDGHVHLLKTWLAMVSQIEKKLSGQERQQAEKGAVGLLLDKINLKQAKGMRLSLGRWQHIVYAWCYQLLCHQQYRLTFWLLRLYVHVCKGEV